MENEVLDFIENSNPRFIIGLIGCGFFFAWLSEVFFSVCSLFVQWGVKKIKELKGNKDKNVWYLL